MMNPSCNKQTLLTTSTSAKSCLSVVLFLFISGSVIKLLIEPKTIEKEKKEAIKEMLTQIVRAYDEGSDHSRDWRYSKSFTDNLIKTYEVLVLNVCKGSIFISLRCRTLEGLEHLWSDYRSGDLDKLAERYLVTDEIKKKLNLETSYLKTNMDEENYLNCKKALMGLPSTCSGEYKQNSWEVEAKLGLSVSRMYNLPVVHGKKCNNDYNNCHRYQLDCADDDNVDCNLYSSKALRSLYKSYEDTEIYALLDTIQVKYFIFCDEIEKEKNLCKKA